MGRGLHSYPACVCTVGVWLGCRVNGPSGLHPDRWLDRPVLEMWLTGSPYILFPHPFLSLPVSGQNAHASESNCWNESCLHTYQATDV